MYPRNAASPEPIAIGAVVQISDGVVQTSGCTVRIKPIGVAEGDGAGTTAYSTDGIVLYTPTQGETNYTSFILIAKKTGCIPVSITIVTTESAVAGRVSVGMLAGVVQSLTDLKDFADDGYDPSTNKVQGVVLVDTLTTLTNLPAITSNWLTATGLATDAVNEIRNAITNGSYALDTDANGRIRVVDGTGAGEISLTSGLLDWNSAWDAEVQSEVNDALVALNLDHLLAVATGSADMTVEVVDNSIVSRMLSNGDTSVFDPSTDGLQPIRDRGDATWLTATGFSTHSAADVWAVATRVLTAATNITAAIADQVWEEAIADHSGTAGSTAEALGAAGSAGDPWTTALPGAYGAGSAGFILGTNLDVILSARTLASASYATASALATVDTVVDGIQTDLSNATDGLGALKALIDALPSRSSITGGNYALDTDANGRVRVVDGTGTGELDTLSGTVLLRSATQASIDAIEADTNELQSDDVPGLIAALNNITAASVWAAGTRTLTAGTNIALAKGTGVTGFNDLDASGIRSATGLASANLDTQLGDIPTNSELTTALASADDAVLAAISALNNLSQSQVTGGAYALSTDANGRVRIVDGTGVGELDTLSGTVLLRSATQTSIDAIEADTNELQGDWVNGGRLDLLIDAIKAKTDQMTYSVANKLDSNPTPTSAICNRIADHVRRRTQANVEASSDGDTLDLSSLYGFIQQAQESSISGTTLTVNKTDGTTSLGTKTLTSNASAEPVTGIA